MSIISQEAARRYPRLAYPGYEDPARGDTGLQTVYTSDDLQEAYMDGADREPTDVEMEAAAERIFSIDRDEFPLPLDIDWNTLPQSDKDFYRRLVRASLAAIHDKVIQEEEAE